MKYKYAYIRTGVGCPCCGVDAEISRGELACVPGGTITRDMTCKQCGLEWTDIFNLADIITEE